MSIFKVEAVKINRVAPHPKADRLDIITFGGMTYPVISAKGSLIPESYLNDLTFVPTI